MYNLFKEAKRDLKSLNSKLAQILYIEKFLDAFEGKSEASLHFPKAEDFSRSAEGDIRVMFEPFEGSGKYTFQLHQMHQVGPTEELTISLIIQSPTGEYLYITRQSLPIELEGKVFDASGVMIPPFAEAINSLINRIKRSILAGRISHFGFERKSDESEEMELSILQDFREDFCGACGRNIEEFDDEQ